MKILQKNIYSEKNGNRPRLLIPKKWVAKNGKQIEMLVGENFIILLPLTENKNAILEKIKKSNI